MAQYNNTAYIVEVNPDTGLDTGLYTVNGVVKKFTGSTCLADALTYAIGVKGEDEFKIVQDVQFTVTEAITP
jgi:hypothetical protein